MDENKSTSKSSVALIFVVIVLCAVAGAGYVMRNKQAKVEEDENQEVPKAEVGGSYHEYDSCGYGSLYASDEYIFLDDTVIYECQSTGEFGCYVTQIDDFEYCNQTDSVVLITDNQKDFLYDYESFEVIFEADSFEKAIYDDLGQIAYLIFKNNGKEGIVSLKGELLIAASYDLISIDYGSYTGEYSLDNGVVVAKDGNYYGVLEIETGNVIVPFEYDNISIYDEYYVLTKNNKTYLVDSELNVILDDDFDNMTVSNSVVLAEKSGKLYFYDLTGEQIIEDIVSINRTFQHSDDTGYISFSMDQYNKVITLIVLGDDKYTYEACYDLDLTDKSLTEFDCNEVYDFDEE